MNLRGIFAPLTTPFAGDGGLLLDRLSSDVERYNSTGLSGYLILGSSGEAIYLNREEKIEVLRTAIEAAAPDKLALAGTGEESLRATLEMNEAAAAMGYPAAVVRTPHYYKPAMTTAALVRFYSELADRSPIPILLYNMPPLTGLDLTLEAILELAQHPRILGIKESAGNMEKLIRITTAGQRDFAVLVGAAASLYPSLCVGADGAILAFASAAPEACVELAAAYWQNDHVSALRLQRELLPGCRALAQFGIAGLKAASASNGYYGGPPRLPQLPLPAEGRAQVESAFAPLITLRHASVR